MCVLAFTPLLEVVHTMYSLYLCLWDVVYAWISVKFSVCASHLMCLKIACVSLYMHVFSKRHVCRE